MSDLLYVVLLVALTALGALFVIGCEKTVGPDELELVEEPRTRSETVRQPEELAA